MRGNETTLLLVEGILPCCWKVVDCQCSVVLPVSQTDLLRSSNRDLGWYERWGERWSRFGRGIERIAKGREAPMGKRPRSILFPATSRWVTIYRQTSHVRSRGSPSAHYRRLLCVAREVKSVCLGSSGVQLQQASDDLAHVCGVGEGEQKQ